jgi:hypothetical protein
MSSVQSPVLLVDQHTGFNPATDLRDNFHPNEQGERKIAHNWAVALLPLLRSATAAGRPGPPRPLRVAAQAVSTAYTLTGRRVPPAPRGKGITLLRSGGRCAVIAE